MKALLIYPVSSSSFYSVDLGDRHCFPFEVSFTTTGSFPWKGTFNCYWLEHCIQKHTKPQCQKGKWHVLIIAQPHNGSIPSPYLAHISLPSRPSPRLTFSTKMWLIWSPATFISFSDQYLTTLVLCVHCSVIKLSLGFPQKQQIQVKCFCT